MATHSSVLAWRIPWTEELGQQESMGSQRFGHDKQLSTWSLKETVGKCQSLTHALTSQGRLPSGLRSCVWSQSLAWPRESISREGSWDRPRARLAAQHHPRPTQGLVQARALHLLPQAPCPRVCGRREDGALPGVPG